MSSGDGDVASSMKRTNERRTAHIEVELGLNGFRFCGSGRRRLVVVVVVIIAVVAALQMTVHSQTCFVARLHLPVQVAQARRLLEEFTRIGHFQI
jgi:hypothetical protein